jgi:hypothetical protein
MASSVLALFRFLLRHPEEDLTDIRKLIAMCAMLLAHLDIQVITGTNAFFYEDRKCSSRMRIRKSWIRVRIRIIRYRSVLA